MGNDINRREAEMKKSHIVIHHSLTEDGKAYDWQAIRKYHIEVKAFDDIGYHWGLEMVNGVPQVMMGRYPDENGAHCPDWGMNRTGFGVCVVGNFDNAKPSPEVWGATLKFTKWIMREYGIRVQEVVGHGEAQRFAHNQHPRSCPGRFWDMEQFRADLLV
jgi:hypothetical protein